jgi:putative ABC transport system substrate-binding protein
MISRRRAFLAFLGYALTSRQIVAQQVTTPHTVGVLMGLADDAEAHARAEAFEDGLRREGWLLGENLRIEYRFSGGDLGRMQAFVTELVTLKPDCILGHSTPVVKLLSQATQTIPIVFVAVTDPIGSKIVANKTRPGGNITGFSIAHDTIASKYVSMLSELVPQLSQVAIIDNPDQSDVETFFLRPFVEAATMYKVEPITIQVHNPAEVESSFAQLASKPDSGLIVLPDNFAMVHRELYISAAARYRIPTIYSDRSFAEAGGLLSYGVDPVDVFRLASVYVSRILRGVKPGDLPVQLPTKFELVINLKTANELGLTIPTLLLAGADALIQ